MKEVDLAALIQEIEALPEAPEFAHAAVFDADHTLWAGDLGDDAFLKALAERRFRAEAQPAISEILARAGETPRGEVHEDAARVHALYKTDKISEHDIIALELVCYAGWTVDEVRGLAKEILAAGLEERFHAEAEPLLRALEERGYSLHVVSGSAHWLVEAAVEGLGIHAQHVLGAQVHLDGQRLSTRLRLPLTFWEGKLTAIETWLAHRRPRLVFGDSAGDLAMLVSAQLPVAVNPRPGLVRALDEQRPGAWRRLLPQATTGGHPVTRHETDRVIV